MLNLLRCEYVRMFRYSSFIKYTILTALFNLVCVFLSYCFGVYEGTAFNNDSTMLAGYVFMLLFAPIITSSFVGNEFSNGTMRNKLISGKQHYQILLADFIVCLSTIVLLNLFGLLISYIVGGIVSTMPCEHKLYELLLNFAYSIVFFAVLTALYLFISLTVQNHSKGNILSILAGFLLMISPIFLVIPGKIYDVASTIGRYLPSTNLYKLIVYNTDNIARYSICSAFAAVLLIGTGIFAFRKKNAN